MKKRLWIALLILGLLMIGVGIWRGEPRLILEKAIRVCLECIGIG